MVYGDVCRVEDGWAEEMLVNFTARFYIHAFSCSESSTGPGTLNA